MRLQFVLSIVLFVVGPVASASESGAQTTVEPTSGPVVSPSLAPTIPQSSAVTTGTPLSPMDPAASAAMMQSFQGMMLEQRRLSDETRSAMLGSLTPAHRSYVASLVGELAIAPSPDPAATARQINATLSQSERQGVLRADAERVARERAELQRRFSEMTTHLTTTQRSAIQAQVVQSQVAIQHLTPQPRDAMSRQAQQLISTVSPGTMALGTPQTAGQLLLRALTSHGNIMGF